MKNLLDKIPNYAKWNKIKYIDKGWSKDKKFYIEDDENNKLLLRISQIDFYEQKEKEFESIKKIYKLGVLMSKPIEFGVSTDNKNVYSLYSWIEGNSANDIINNFSQEEQYNLGVQAGKILRKFHSIKAPNSQMDWEKRMIKKFERHLKSYKECGIKVENDECALKYINQNIELLNNRPQVYHHGDFHIGNLIITPQNKLGVIDFNRWDYGDPYEEFYKMMIFSRELSIPFAKGQINGYFNKIIPQDFFKIVSLYLADVILYSVVWAIPFGKKDVDGMIKRAEMILDDYDNFTTYIPKWYTNE